MDINTINTIISKAFNNKSQKPIRVGQYDKDTVGVTIDGFVMWFIPGKDFIFDADKLRRGTLETNINALIPPKKCVEEAIRTNKLIQDGKRTLSEIMGPDFKVYLDTKLLKAFDKNATYKVSGSKTPVLVYENDILVGLVCPTRCTVEV